MRLQEAVFVTFPGGGGVEISFALLLPTAVTDMLGEGLQELI